MLKRRQPSISPRYLTRNEEDEDHTPLRSALAEDSIEEEEIAAEAVEMEKININIDNSAIEETIVITSPASSSVPSLGSSLFIDKLRLRKNASSSPSPSPRLSPRPSSDRVTLIDNDEIPQLSDDSYNNDKDIKEKDSRKDIVFDDTDSDEDDNNAPMVCLNVASGESIEMQHLSLPDESESDQNACHNSLTVISKDNHVQPASASSPLSQSTSLMTPSSTTPSIAANSVIHNMKFWLIIVFLNHTAWGLHPVLGRYLQIIAKVPSMQLLALANGSVLALTFPYAVITKKFDFRVLLSPPIWGFGISVVARSMTNLISSRFTSAIYVQLVTQLTPFIVPILNRWMLGEKIPSKTYTSTFFCLIGAVLTMCNHLGEGGFISLTHNDYIGLALAATSTFFLSLYMVMVRRTKSASPETVFTFQLMVIVLFSLILSSTFGEDWSAWTHLNTKDWLMFLVFVVGVSFGANVGQIVAIRAVGAPVVSSILAWRLICSLLFSMALLGEGLESGFQIAGAIVVFATVTVFLFHQKRAAEAAVAAAAASAAAATKGKEELETKVITISQPIEKEAQNEEESDESSVVEEAVTGKNKRNNDRIPLVEKQVIS